MADGEVEQWQPEREDVVEAVDVLSSNKFESSPEELEKYEDSSSDSDSHVSDVLKLDDDIGGAKVDGTTNVKNEIVPSQKEIGESSGITGELLEEEVVELEFEKVKPQLETHSMHCPNCKSEVTKVILRRKLYRTPKEQDVPPEPQPDPPKEDLVGCLSCLSLFTCSDGCFNPFDIFPKTRTSTDPVTTSPPKPDETESCFSMFWVGKEKQKPEDPEQYLNPVYGSLIAQGATSSSSPTGRLHTVLEVVDKHGVDIAPSSGRPWLGRDGLLIEILKSIVYGGLMEVIASLSVVASAAASDTTTLGIVALALASLVGGVFVIGHNLWDLRDNCHKESSNKQKYKELLGEINYFPLHAFFAILSFLVFGMVPPVAYGYAFHETDDKDYTIVVIAVVSLLCVALLATFKAHINKCTVFDYLKTVVYYIITAISVSGVSYVAGNLATRLMEEYGLFTASSSGGVSSLLTPTTTSSLASF